MSSGRFIDYMGAGTIASRPAAPDLYAGALGIYVSIDTTPVMASFWVSGAWIDFPLLSDASALSYDNGASGLSADNVQAALDEIVTIIDGGSAPTESIVVAVGDEITAITTGVAKVTFRMPYAFTVTDVRASLTTASSSGIPTVDINEAGVTILSTKLTIDSGEKTSTTAAAPPVISDASLADDAEMTIDIDVAGTGAAGLKVTLIGHQ